MNEPEPKTMDIEQELHRLQALEKQYHDLLNFKISLRDQFAMAAMTGFIMRGESGQGYAERVARMSFNVADAMIADRSRP